MENIRKHLSLLGLKAKDKVTGAKGVIDSIAFDLYGCVQASMNHGIDKKEEHKGFTWYDIARVEAIDKKPVMDIPNFGLGKEAEGKKGPANKAQIHQS